MKQKAISSAVLSLLGIQNLLASNVYANSSESLTTPHTQEFKASQNSTHMAERAIQKRLVGFDPKQAVETLSYLQRKGITEFQPDGSINISQESIQDLIETAAIDGIEVRILELKNDDIKVKFAAHNVTKFDRSRIEEAKELADAFQLKCDMDGKMM